MPNSLEVSTSGGTLQPPRPAPVDYATAARRMREEFAWNPWFLRSYEPENAPRLEFMARVAQSHVPAPARALEVGCGTGNVAYIFRSLGYDVDAVDAYEEEERDRMFARLGIRFRKTNLNSATPLDEFPDASFDVVLLGEVFEHILNQPAGLLRSVHRLLSPGGIVVLSTPNPSTLGNAMRVLRDDYVLWGTDEFLRETKLDGTRIIDRGGIHYREYPARIVRDLLREVGFRVEGLQYMQMGVAPAQPLVKRLAKRIIQLSGAGRYRLFSPDYVIWATRPR